MKSFAPFTDGEMEFLEVEASDGLAEVHMLTGENGTGKTRVLTALMAAMGNIGPLQDRVRQDSGTELEVDAYHLLWKGFDARWSYRNGGEDPEPPARIPS
jgi:DNA repair ATPase RecN